ncbi:MAG: tyrosine-type recombinase/integrase, partial [Myxococcales bacterium]|nr:tyrosine-type recombinase/integrase [Myxococcales bacterium]
MSDTTDQTPKTAKLNKPPRRQLNASRRTREYLTASEIEKLRQAAREQGRHPHRDEMLILLMFRHALRASEVACLKWEQIDLAEGII